MFDLSFSALTVASHVTMCLAILMLFDEGVRLAAIPNGMQRAMQSEVTRIAAFATVAMIFVERLYYIAARLLKPHGLDLWMQHPAPEVLSGAISLSIFGLAVAGRVTTAAKVQDWLKPVVWRAVALAVIWVSTALVLS